MQSAPHQSDYRLPGPHYVWVAAASLIALVVVALFLLAGLSGRREDHRGPANPEGRFQSTTTGSPPPLGGFGAVPLPPTL